MSDILCDPEVIKVAKEMGLDVTGKGILCPQTVEGCVASVAFLMRDKCDALLWRQKLSLLSGWSSNGYMCVSHTTPEQWIRAACAAWRMK